MIAVIKTGGKQYIVKPGDMLKIEKIDAKQGDEISLEVLMTAEGDAVKIGAPMVADGSCKAEVVEQGRADKVEVVHYKCKVRHIKRSGHRQPYTKIKIKSVA